MAVAGCVLPGDAFASSRGSRLIFGAGRGLVFYKSSELITINERLGNSPRLTVEHEFGRTQVNQVTFEQTRKRDVWLWGAELQQWGETHRGFATNGEDSPRSEATLAFTRLWITGGVRLWPWVGPTIVRQNTNLTGLAVRMPSVRPLGSGPFSWLRLAAGSLLWKHDYLLYDAANQTEIDYASRSASWDVGVRWTVGWRLGSFCDIGADFVSSRSFPFKSQTLVGQYSLSGRDSRDVAVNLGVEQLAKARWETIQSLVFVRFFYP